MENPIHTEVTLITHASLEHTLNELWRKGYETKDFLKAVENVIIHERTDDYILRTMNLGPKLVKEKITRDIPKGMVVFTNI